MTTEVDWQGPAAAARYLEAVAHGRRRPSLTVRARAQLAALVPFVLVGIVAGACMGVVDILRGRI